MLFDCEFNNPVIGIVKKEYKQHLITQNFIGMAENTFSIDFIARKKKSDTSIAKIYSKISLDGQYVEVCLKDEIPHGKWSWKAEKVIGKTIEALDINEHIENVRQNLRNHYRKLVDKQLPFTVHDIKDAFLGFRKQKNKEHTLLALMGKHKETFEGKLAKGTMKNYVSTTTYLRNFIAHQITLAGKSSPNADLYINYVNFEFLTAFENYIPLHPLEAHDRCNANGTAKHIERFKKIVNWAVLLGWLDHNPVANYTPFRVKTFRQKLQWHFINVMERMSFPRELAEVRDLFIFSCFTGYVVRGCHATIHAGH